MDDHILSSGVSALSADASRPERLCSPRKRHTKSRTGCRTCKSRKIKCDEHHPACRNCMRKGVECDFVALNCPSIVAPARLDLELLHNFTISTALTLSTNPQVINLWRITVPRIGFSTEYILNGILALSALHVARHHPERRDTMLLHATQQHTASLRVALPLMSSITKENCSQLFLFGVLTLFFNLANAKEAGDMLIVGNSGLPDWLYLLRGIEAVLKPEEDTVLSSPVSLIIRTSMLSFEFWCQHSPTAHAPLEELEAAVRADTTDDKLKQEILLEAIQALKRSYTFFFDTKNFRDDEKLRGFYTWLIEVSDTYLSLLKSVDRHALCIFAFFSVLLHDVNKYWWVEGWAVHIIRRIYLLLTDEYRLWLRWPIEQIGWIP